MKYYTKKTSTNKRILVFLSIIISLLILFIYMLDKIILSTLMVVADGEMRTRAIEVIDRNILDLYDKEFNYDDIMKIEKDGQGNITMIRADTIKLNSLAAKVSLESQNKLRDMGAVGIKIPIGYISKNVILSNLGPSVKVRMQPIGSVKTNYISEFESAGINQTRHKIYLEVETSIKVIIATKSDEVQIKNTIPVAETIIVGKVPTTNLDFGK
ncbi:sporulation protein YunB [Clostridium intestinale]|uniref:Sporulation protein YunB n=1 Tax=Clostridium intestinale TaxID=36845 RepID=A0A7D6VT41_9CLOT|nr:sporulation protein YunB [Clostridium intestinale]QLY78472.1 sporulation protein YunB [Clostridium intestinale]WRY53562.1 sporulation protein YunB [Clostridium intestinale]